MKSIEVGQGFRIEDGIFELHGLVLDVNEHGIDYVEVKPRYINGNRSLTCYDESDADEKHDKDNVLLQSCPPPFSSFGDYRMKPNAVAVADMEHVSYLSFDMMRDANFTILDRGAKISDFDMNRVYCHPMPSKMHRELLRKDYTELALDETARQQSARSLPSVSHVDGNGVYRSEFDFV